MSDWNIVSETRGGLSAERTTAPTPSVPVAPSTAAERNVFRDGLFPIACWRVDDPRFDFGSSFIRPGAGTELAQLKRLLDGHRGARISVFGHADPVGDFALNKRLSGRRARAVYGLLIRDSDIWEQLFNDSEDRWGLPAIQLMQTTVGQTPGTSTLDAAARRQLYVAYMNRICLDASGTAFQLQTPDFLGQGADAGGKGDYQGCSEFNPVLVFSATENRDFQDPARRTERDAANEPNRRVVILVFRPGASITPARWPCPRASEDIAGCQLRFWSDWQTRLQNQTDRRRFEDSQNTLACRFYHRLLSGSPCENIGARPPVLERISTAIPWPRGIVYDRNIQRVIVLARGRLRSNGGADPTIRDEAGTLFVVNPDISELASVNPAGANVVGNVERRIAPDPRVFRLYNPPPNDRFGDQNTDRPYAGLTWDQSSNSYFVVCFSGIDTDQGFQKNPTDAIHRYDNRVGGWFKFESHDPAVVPDSVMRTRPAALDSSFYPSSNPSTTQPPHGLLNGPDGICVSRDWVYAVAKDNHLIVRYALAQIRSNSAAGPPSGEVLFQGRQGQGSIDGPSAIAVYGNLLYVGARTNSELWRFTLNQNGGLPRNPTPELVGTFPGAGVIDIAVTSNGEVFVSGEGARSIWRLRSPDPANAYDGSRNDPYVTLPDKCTNIALDDHDRLYICCNAQDNPNGLPGVVYRATG